MLPVETVYNKFVVHRKIIFDWYALVHQGVVHYRRSCISEELETIDSRTNSQIKHFIVIVIAIKHSEFVIDI